jgi:ADP-heptose:LPS heptosyltransferase
MPGSAYDVVPDVRKIVVLRPNALGDFIFCLPALHALRAAYPSAKISFIGKHWHADLLHGRPGPIDEVLVMPPCPGVGAAPDAQVDTGPARRFVEAMRAERFDIALQLYGGGRYSNPFIRRLGAGLTVGMKAADAEPLDRSVPYPYLHNKRLLMLEVAALVGARTLRVGREIEVIARDRQEAARAVADDIRPLVIINPCASDPRRHWPAERFAAVAGRLAEEGAVVAINGTGAESALVRRVIGHMRRPAIDLCGKLSLSGLCGLFERAALLVSNDSGPLHLALAVGTPSVGIYWLTNLFDGFPLVQSRHRASMSPRVHCPVCGEPNLTTRCPHDVSFVADVTVEEVTGLALDLYREHLSGAA